MSAVVKSKTSGSLLHLLPSRSQQPLPSCSSLGLQKPLDGSLPTTPSGPAAPSLVPATADSSGVGLAAPPLPAVGAWRKAGERIAHWLEASYVGIELSGPVETVRGSACLSRLNLCRQPSALPGPALRRSWPGPRHTLAAPVLMHTCMPLAWPYNAAAPPAWLTDDRASSK